MRYQLELILVVLLATLMTSCISVSLGGPHKTLKAKMSFTRPDPPFIPFNVSSADYSWKSSRSGSVIGLISDCDPSADLSLETLRSEVIQSLKDVILEKETPLTFQGRAALRSVMSGKVDGVKTHVDLLVFKKNGCSYTASLIALPQRAIEDTPHFDRFLNHLVTP